MQLWQGDCLKLMKNIPDKSIDMVLCDLPYGVTKCRWDTVIPFEPLWEQYKRITKDNSAILLFSQQPFTSKLVCSNLNMFRYEWIYQKSRRTGFLNAKKMPLKIHENVLVFYKKLPKYNPIFSKGKPYTKKASSVGQCYGRALSGVTTVNDGKRFPCDVIKFSNSEPNTLHPTKKPADLCEYFVKTYTDVGDTVLDNCMGSGSTGVACVNTGRNFIGIELDENYFNIAKQRIENAQKSIGIHD